MSRKAHSNPEDQAVKDVEHILDKAGRRHQPDRELSVRHALALCACDTAGDDSPTWLIYDDAEGDLFWCRVADEIEPLSLVDAQLSAGGHTGPMLVRGWLQGHVQSVAGAEDDLWGDTEVFEKLVRRIRAATA